MSAKKQIQVDEKVPLNLTAAERKLVLDGVTLLDDEFEQIIRETPTGKPVMVTLDDLDDFGGYIAAEANHCEDKKKEKKLDAIFEKIQQLLGTYTDEEPPQILKIEDARKKRVISDQAVPIAEQAAKALVAAEQLGIKKKPLEKFWLAPAQRDVLILIPGVTNAIKNKLTSDGAAFSIAEVASMAMALAEDLPDGDARKQVAVMHLAKHLMDHLQTGIARNAEPLTTRMAKRTGKSATDQLYQFKITLLDITPPIWRRIQVQDSTLDKLHEHIQTAMGWTNSHLHQFEIKGERYGDPELLDDDFGDSECVDSTTTMVSKIVSKTSKRLAFKYEYDFGDGWDHEVLFEGCPPVDPKAKYPLCLEGERACPPEDVGGVWGYQEFLVAIADPKHKEHENLLRWCGGKFSPGEFDPARATRAMKKGLLDWRAMRNKE
jgi:hypothetical protein